MSLFPVVEIESSKSLCNRFLILNSLYDRPFTFQNLSKANDVLVLERALHYIFQHKTGTIDIQDCGTAMRFLTSFLSIQEGKKCILTGSECMKRRPIKLLVDALRSLGADITYLGNEGFPPLEIKGKKIEKNTVYIDGHISSQYITSLMLIGSTLEKGLCIELTSKLTSKPYVEMTQKMLQSLAINCEFFEHQITIQPKTNIPKKQITIESDWSSASYYYNWISKVKNTSLCLQHFSPKSWQGDAEVASIYEKYFGVKTDFLDDETIVLKNSSAIKNNAIELNLVHYPDLAQTICVTALLHKIPIHILGLETLLIKETNRLLALQNELQKCGAEVEISKNSITILSYKSIPKNIVINTYNDHRMAMAFAPLSILYNAEIHDKNVVEKSYPNFWNDWEKIIEL